MSQHRRHREKGTRMPRTLVYTVRLFGDTYFSPERSESRRNLRAGCVQFHSCLRNSIAT